jgi:hypothetical protein
MSRTDFGPLIRRAALLLLAALPLAAISSTAAVRPRVENPHGSFKEECALCHDAKGWKPARISSKFDHSRYGFPLEGAHAAGNCMGCHKTLEFKQSKFTCVSCHEDPHRAEMGTDCARCHSARSFVDRAPMVRAHQMTRLPLTGSHAVLDCESCHRPAAQGQMRFVGTRADCQSCHMKDYEATRNPSHRSGGFPTDCEQCHRTLTWNAARFEHDRSRFPLTGAHRSASCSQCHGDGVYAGKPTGCVTCHQPDYSGASNPNHVTAGYSTECQSCHSTSSWASASVDHNLTRFPLTGAHRSASCNQCHGDGVYAGRPTACLSCHQGDYNGVTDPNHVSAGFSTACETCHTTAAWAPSSFDHDSRWFPIYTGSHAGRWNQCSTCHNAPVNFKVFTCLTCHPHSDRTKTDGDHSGRSGYSYTSAGCYSCHPRGRS